ncbi:MAG: hypothetical protein Q7R94_01860 [bacterium]|nr:hypothetical protein [bacterium]
MQRYFKREILVGLSVIFGSILLLGAALLLLSSDISAQTEGVVGGRDLISERAATLNALAELKRDSPVASKYREAMRKILVTRDDLLDFSRWLEGLARGRGAVFSFAFQGEPSPPTEENPGNIAFSMRVSGGLDVLLGFLEDIEYKAPRFLLSIDSFNVRADGSGYTLAGVGKVFFRQ